VNYLLTNLDRLPIGRSRTCLEESLFLDVFFFRLRSSFIFVGYLFHLRPAFLGWAVGDNVAGGLASEAGNRSRLGARCLNRNNRWREYGSEYSAAGEDFIRRTRDLDKILG
jgi:hypothetical protein